jgi:membrane protein DedA with SNARE-associated domain
MHLYSELLQFIENYGYIGVFLGALLEGEAIMLISGFLVHQKVLHFDYILLFGFLGAVIGDTAWFLLGKYKGEKLLNRFAWLRKVSTRPVSYISKKPAMTAFWVRFIYGFRHIIPMSLGMTKYPLYKFVFWNSLGAMFWVASFVYGGYLLGDILESVVGHLRKYQLVTVLLVIVLVVVFNLIARLFKKSIEGVVKE